MKRHNVSKRDVIDKLIEQTRSGNLRWQHHDKWMTYFIPQGVHVYHDGDVYLSEGESVFLGTSPTLLALVSTQCADKKGGVAG